MEEKNIVNKKNLLIGIMLILVAIAVGTYAWYSYQTKRSAMVLTVGEINKLRVTLSPYQFSGTLTPTTTYTGSSYTQITAVNNVSSDGKINVYYQINSIDSALINSGFKYTICKSTDGSNYPAASCTTGNFASASTVTGSTVPVLTNESIAGSSTVYYRVYLWIDSSSGNQSAMQGKIFDGELRADILTTLPSAYQQVEYIRSTGTQYIDTGVSPSTYNGNYAIELEEAHDLISSNMYIAGTSAGSTSATSRANIRINSGGTSCSVFVNNASGSAIGVNANGVLINSVNYIKYTVSTTNSSRTLQVNSTTNSSSEAFVSSSTANFKLFGYSTGNFVGMIYSAKIYGNGTMVRNMIPCYRRSDNVAGLYDVINDDM